MFQLAAYALQADFGNFGRIGGSSSTASGSVCGGVGPGFGGGGSGVGSVTADRRRSSLSVVSSTGYAATTGCDVGAGGVGGGGGAGGAENSFAEFPHVDDERESDPTSTAASSGLPHKQQHQQQFQPRQQQPQLVTPLPPTPSFFPAYFDPIDYFPPWVIEKRGVDFLAAHAPNLHQVSLPGWVTWPARTPDFQLT